jgi:hypothetical protein
VSRIHIFGLDHFHQNLETACMTIEGIEEEQRQKAELSGALRGLINENSIDLIAEEGKYDRLCLGGLVARECGIAYVNITMPIEEREKHGIRTPQYNFDKSTIAAAYRIFEEYMFTQTVARDAKSILMMCGRYHLQSLSQLFSEAGHDVYAHDINDCPWYRGIPQEGSGRLIGYEKEP